MQAITMKTLTVGHFCCALPAHTTFRPKCIQNELGDEKSCAFSIHCSLTLSPLEKLGK